MKFTNSLRTSLYTTVGALLLALSSFAQAPEKMSYQAVIRGANNALVTNQQVGMQISILQGSTAVYEETQTPTSNTNGLVSLEIGTGTVISGSFTAIDWSAGTYFIKTETDPTGGTNYTISGTSQLMSVPYALYAKTSGNVAGQQGPIGSTMTSGITKANHETDKLGTQLGYPSSYAPSTNFAGVAPTGAPVSTVVGLNFPVDQPLASNIDSEVLTQAGTVWLQKHVSNGLTEPTTAGGFDPIAELGSMGSNAFSMLQPSRQISALVSFGCDLQFKPSKTGPTEIISRFMYYDPNDPTNTGAGESNYRNWKKIRQCEIKTHLTEYDGLGSSLPPPTTPMPWGQGFYTETLDHSEYKSVLVNLNPAYFYTVMIQIETFAHDGIVLTRDKNHASTLTIIEVGGDTTGSAGE
jgi:hypothetical protein